MNFQIRWGATALSIRAKSKNPGDKPNDIHEILRLRCPSLRTTAVADTKNPDRKFDPGFEMLPRRCRSGGSPVPFQ